ncbi:hypothetical protein [Salidesulfovibrio brasiliensis]|uniref:hypothetical protein n=1 Tax=Salidesulfovibrio brasiliensis TaxID=221711 RepID=UPI0006CF2325|nr:hypothetical protein [Salidesulfovibrio brasiliensis]
MWARMQEMGIRREAPLPMEPGMTVEGYRVKETLKPVTGFRRYTAMKDWQGYELRQFYDVNTDASCAGKIRPGWSRFPIHRQCFTPTGNGVAALPCRTIACPPSDHGFPRTTA